jgi:hypothetical protein
MISFRTAFVRLIPPPRLFLRFWPDLFLSSSTACVLIGPTKRSSEPPSQLSPSLAPLSLGFLFPCLSDLAPWSATRGHDQCYTFGPQDQHSTLKTSSPFSLSGLQLSRSHLRVDGVHMLTGLNPVSDYYIVYSALLTDVPQSAADHLHCHACDHLKNEVLAFIRQNDRMLIRFNKVKYHR